HRAGGAADGGLRGRARGDPRREGDPGPARPGASGDRLRRPVSVLADRGRVHAVRRADRCRGAQAARVLSRTLVWQGLELPLMEIAYADLDGGTLRARGTQIGVEYELRYELEPGRLRAHVVDAPEIDIGLEDDAEFFDTRYSPPLTW